MQNGTIGTCGQTVEGVSSCFHGNQGNFLWPKEASSSWQNALAACQNMCSSCPRCGFISMSLQWRDCSWFSSCDFEHLNVGIAGFQSFRVKQPAPSTGCSEGSLQVRARRQVAKTNHSSEAVVLLGVFSFSHLAGAAQRRSALRRLMPSSSAATVRFVMLASERELAMEKLAHGDIWDFDLTGAGDMRSWRELGKYLLQNAFFRLAVSAEQPSYRFIGRADDDAVFNVSGVAARLASVWRLYAASSGSSAASGAATARPQDSGPFLAYGAFHEWYMWDLGKMHATCWAHGHERAANERQALVASHGNLSRMPNGHTECIMPGVRGPFPFAGGALTIYSAPLARRLVASVELEEDERRVRMSAQAEVEAAAAAEVLHRRKRADRGVAIWEDVYFGYLTWQLLQATPVRLLLAPFAEIGLAEMLADCRLWERHQQQALSSLTYHGLKQPRQFHPFLDPANAYLLHHEEGEHLECSRLISSATHKGKGRPADTQREASAEPLAAWRLCRFRSREGKSLDVGTGRRRRS